MPMKFNTSLISLFQLHIYTLVSLVLLSSMDEIFFDLFDAEQLNNICVLLDITIPKMKLD